MAELPGRPNYKLRVPIQEPTPIRQVEIVLANEGFLAFSQILGLRIFTGHSTAALRMLRSIGATGQIAYKIIDGWVAARSECDERLSVFLTPAQVAAVYFSRFIDDLTLYDWPELLWQARGVAEEDSTP